MLQRPLGAHVRKNRVRRGDFEWRSLEDPERNRRERFRRIANPETFPQIRYLVVTSPLSHLDRRQIAGFGERAPIGDDAVVFAFIVFWFPHLIVVFPRRGLVV